MSDSLTVTGTTTPVTVYGTYAAAKDYIASAYGPLYTAWTALQPDDQKRTLIAAVRLLEQQSWDPVTAATFVIRDAIAAFGQAEYELAVLIADSPDLVQQHDQGSNVQSAGAGSARVSFFAPTSAADGTATVLPPIVERLIGSYLASADNTSLSIASGTGETSHFDDDDDDPPFARTWPL